MEFFRFFSVFFHSIFEIIFKSMESNIIFNSFELFHSIENGNNENSIVCFISLIDDPFNSKNAQN